MRSELGKLTLDKVFRVRPPPSPPAGSETLLTSGCLSGTRVPQRQHRPLHQPGVRRVGDPLPPVRDQRHPRPSSGQRVHADAGEPGRGQVSPDCPGEGLKRVLVFRSRPNARREPRCWSLRGRGRRPLTWPKAASRLRFWPRRERRRSGSTRPWVGAPPRAHVESRLLW